MRRFAALIVLAVAACQGADVPPPVATLDRPRNVANRDDVLQNVIGTQIRALDQTAFRSVTVEVWNGHVALLGAVTRPDQRRRAEQIAQSVTGISDVSNDLVMTEPANLDLYRPDFEREDIVRRQLGIEGKTGLTVRVINGVAYLLGAGSAETAQALKAAATDIDGIKWAVTHINPTMESKP